MGDIMSTAITSSKIPFFGRAWSLTITPNAGPSAGTPIVITSDTFEPEALRMTFEVTQLAFSAFWHAEITIWNANGPISSGPSKGINLYQAIIQEGDMVTLAAGYQFDYPPPSIPPVIWNGPIFYTIQDRPDIVDQRLIIHCLLNRALTTQNFLNATLPARSTQFSQAQFIAENAVNKIGIRQSQVQSALAAAKPQRGSGNLPRAKTYFGNPHHYLNKLADQANCLSWFDATHWNIDTLQTPTGPLVGTYAPVIPLGPPPQTASKVSFTLVGHPRQTQLGVDFRILIDPLVQVVAPLVKVGLAIQYIRQAPIGYPLSKGSFPPLPLVDQYVVIGVCIRGDTRGNEWYTEITGAAQILTAIQLLGQSGQADATGN